MSLDLDTIGRAVSILATAAVFAAMIGIFAVSELDLWRERQARRRARAQHPIADRFRAPPGGWTRRG